jgi:hypothetical protein
MTQHSRQISRLLAASAAALLVVACASNDAVVTNSWIAKDIENRQELDGVLVLAISKNSDNRQRFEAAFTEALVTRGVRAVASYTLNDAAEITRPDIVAMASAKDLDTVLVTSYAGRDEHEVLHPGATYYRVAPIYTPHGGYYGRGGVYGAPYEVAHVPDFYAQHISVHLEINLYEVSTEKHLWQVAAGITESEDNREMIDGFISTFMDQLEKDLKN